MGILFSAIVAAAQSPADPTSVSVIRIDVDASDAPRKLLHARLEIPVRPGPLTLYYPKWVPGDHSPDGPIVDLAGLRFTAGGRRLAWRRDLFNMYAFHVEVPPGVVLLDTTLDFLISPPRQGANSSGAGTENVTVVSWEEVVLYPSGPSIQQLVYEPTLRLPTGWKFGTALPISKAEGSTIHFAPATLRELLDSPVIAGSHFRIIPLATVPTLHEIDIAAENDSELELPSKVVEGYKRLIDEANAFFDSYHYRDYHFLLTLSDEVAHLGLEHHESSDDRVAESTFSRPDLFLSQANLLPHEFTHSWNGKYRRPEDLISPDYQKPAAGDLLWIYEGLTQYLGDVLTARSGLWTAAQYRDQLAYSAATLDCRAGRGWRPLQDTADSTQVLSAIPNDQILSASASEWTGWRRSTDYYDEGTLLWLEVDTKLRLMSGGTRSIRDFATTFFAGANGAPGLKTYSFEDVVNTLRAVEPLDWSALLRSRLDSTDPHAPLGGIENSGWTLEYDETPNAMMEASETANDKVDLTFSLGMLLDADGAIRDVIPGTPAAKARISPGTKVLRANGRKWSPEAIHQAITEAKTSGDLVLELLYGKHAAEYHVEYRGGNRYPHLVRNTAHPDLLQTILQPASEVQP